MGRMPGKLLTQSMGGLHGTEWIRKGEDQRSIGKNKSKGLIGKGHMLRANWEEQRPEEEEKIDRWIGKDKRPRGRKG